MLCVPGYAKNLLVRMLWVVTVGLGLVASEPGTAQPDLRHADPSFRPPVGNEAPDVRIYQPPWRVPQTPDLPVGVPQPQVQPPARFDGMGYGVAPSVQPPLGYSTPKSRAKAVPRKAGPKKAGPQKKRDIYRGGKPPAVMTAPGSQRGAKSRPRSTR